MKELEQINMGNLLLGFALECVALLAASGGSAIVEQFKEPEPDHMVSIWRLPIVQLILLLPRTRLVSFAQGLLGATSAKPTALLGSFLTFLKVLQLARMLAGISVQHP